MRPFSVIVSDELLDKRSQLTLTRRDEPGAPQRDEVIGTSRLSNLRRGLTLFAAS